MSVGETSQNTVWRAEAGADAYVYITGDVDENLDTLNRDEDITDQFFLTRSLMDEVNNRTGKEDNIGELWYQSMG